ncbi:MAG: HAMP domain-containing histidine kinase [Clostridia bacterium]|nr:HAMP domain-containing histidine kinase [Clostridia bacterium]
MTGYRKRFIVTTMSLLGVVLLVGFILLDVFMFINGYHSLENTMQQVVEPWGDPGGNGRDLSQEEPPKKPEGEMPQGNNAAEPPEKPGDEPNGNASGNDGPGAAPEMPTASSAENGVHMQARQRVGDYNIVTVFYTFSKDQITLLTESDEIDEAVVRAVIPKIIEADDHFSLLKEERLIYYIDRDDDTCRIALTDASTYTANGVKNTFVLILVYLGSMAVLFPICLRLSAVAARPMENAIEMERQFVANISHDLKTPITVILANNSILKSDPDASIADQLQWIDSTEGAAKNMMEMVGEMLSLSALESQEQTVTPERVNLSSAAKKSVLQLESIAFDRGIHIDSAIEENVFALATKEYAERICSSLLENALKYEPEKGTALVRLRQEKRKAVLTVRNSGSMIAPEDLPHIFDRFYRADKTRNIRQGHGLGLPIVKQLTELIGAKIDVQSDAEHGTVFTVTFELAK